MQVSFLAGLVTIENPRSKYTFLIIKEVSQILINIFLFSTITLILVSIDLKFFV
ncbi:SidA/IucD/PvdA family monooxygenase [Bacillus stratosphericus]|uniref:SidA/IucD/PvdA family monooxygenase n=1 Tax=Bacillus stratosphericus TaxID=293386 RepID=UPI001CFC2FFD|nr:SidA/IucD/PvdA family monooxygenase [Bacillus stratosphericus]